MDLLENLIGLLKKKEKKNKKKEKKKKKKKKKREREKKANLSRGIVGFGCDDLIFCLVSCRFLERTSLHLENGHILIQNSLGQSWCLLVSVHPEKSDGASKEISQEEKKVIYSK